MSDAWDDNMDMFERGYNDMAEMSHLPSCSVPNCPGCLCPVCGSIQELKLEAKLKIAVEALERITKWTEPAFPGVLQHVAQQALSKLNEEEK